MTSSNINNAIRETAVSLRSIQMLPYPSETKLVSQEMVAPVLKEGCHYSVSQLIDKNMDGSFINNQSKKQEMLSPLRFSSMIIFHKKKIESFSVAKGFTNFF